MIDMELVSENSYQDHTCPKDSQTNFSDDFCPLKSHAILQIYLDGVLIPAHPASAPCSAAR